MVMQLKNQVSQVTNEVRQALADNRPVVALESTLICHGIPRPRNIQLALELEDAVRQNGAVPATIALIEGSVRIGLEADDLHRLAASDDVEKCSVNALAPILASRRLGATTVASTIYLAHKAGIRFMATGGIGGVHRGAETSMDVSADLFELQRSKLVVVAAGAKIILDLERTLEVLETLGVALIGHGTSKLPGFYVCETDHTIPEAPDRHSLNEAIQAQSALDWPSSLLVCNPPPRELAFERHVVENWLDQAIAEARNKTDPWQGRDTLPSEKNG